MSGSGQDSADAAFWRVVAFGVSASVIPVASLALLLAGCPRSVTAVCGPGYVESDARCVPADAGMDANDASDANDADADGAAGGADATDARLDAGCDSGPCGALSCDAGWGDCDEDAATGCETELNATVHCGACDTPCGRDHATVTCATGGCAIDECDVNFGDCDEYEPNGCEMPLTTTANCGTCGIPCSLPHATATCITRTCQIASCAGGYGDCNVDDSDGCELQLNAWYPDSDEDGHGSSSASPAGACPGPSQVIAFNHDDCDDDDLDVYTGQTMYFIEARSGGSWDYDCDGSGSKQYPSLAECNWEFVSGEWRLTAPNVAGWTLTSTVPECGASASYTACPRPPDSDVASRMQGCR